MNNLTLLILSCADFSDLWSNNLLLLETNWSNHPDFFLISDNYGKFNIIDFPQLKVFRDKMSNRLIKAVESIKTKYVFLTFDDYFIAKKVANEKIVEITQFMEKYDISYCGFHRNLKHRKKQLTNLCYLAELDLKETYQINFYPCIWKKESLLACLKNDEDIWKSEVRLTRRARKQGFKAVACVDKNVFVFKDIVRKGKYLISAKRFLKKNNLYISERKTRSIFETIGLGIKTFASRCSPNFLKKFLKKMYRKTGKLIYSDYENEEE